MKIFKFFRSKRNSSENSTHECFAFILMLGQCFAMFPIEGLTKSDVRSLRFRWISWRTFYTFLYLCGVFFMLGSHIYNGMRLPPVTFGHLVTFLFYFTTLATVLLFLRLARAWPQLMKKWTEIDLHMHSYGFCKKLAVRLKIVSAVVLLAALLEHSLYMATALSNIAEVEGWEKFKYFFRTNFAPIFNYLSFSWWNGILLLIVNVMCTFTWNYMDLIIMLISMALAVKFTQITTRLKLAIKNKLKNPLFWKELRNDYNIVCGLCNTVDDVLSDITLLSFANNLFVILVQLLNSLKPRTGGIVARIYFLYSFGFLVLRTAAVCLCAASINEESKKPTALLLSVSPEVYNVEIERFLYKIQADPCALTGRKFFNVTKSLILSIAGAIVTYELVLIQMQIVT